MVLTRHVEADPGNIAARIQWRLSTSRFSIDLEVTAAEVTLLMDLAHSWPETMEILIRPAKDRIDLQTAFWSFELAPSSTLANLALPAGTSFSDPGCWHDMFDLDRLCLLAAARTSIATTVQIKRTAFFEWALAIECLTRLGKDIVIDGLLGGLLAPESKSWPRRDNRGQQKGTY